MNVGQFVDALENGKDDSFPELECKAHLWRHRKWNLDFLQWHLETSGGLQRINHLEFEDLLQSNCSALVAIGFKLFLDLLISFFLYRDFCLEWFSTSFLSMWSSTTTHQNFGKGTKNWKRYFTSWLSWPFLLCTKIGMKLMASAWWNLTWRYPLKANFLFRF